MAGVALRAKGTDAPWYRARDLTDEARAVFRATTVASYAAKRRAMAGGGEPPRHPVNVPRLDPTTLMERQSPNGLRTLSLFSGGGGMDIGFDRAGFEHIANYELMDGAAGVLRHAHPHWNVFGGQAGDVTEADWSPYRGNVDVIHGGPPCQPFSHGGRREGSNDARDMIPAMVSAIESVRPSAFVLENVSGLLTKRFEGYVRLEILAPLEKWYRVRIMKLEASDFGVPQRRRRVFFVGFLDPTCADKFVAPVPTHSSSGCTELDPSASLPRTMGVRQALGLPDIGFDAVAPTIRSGLTGPRHTTSVLNSVSAQRVWEQLEIWPNGVAETRERASAYAAKDGHFRMSVPDCMVIQGFPSNWPITSPVYFALGLIGNAVAPPMAYRVARAVQAALLPTMP